MKEKILVYDDVRGFTSNWVDQLNTIKYVEKNYEVKPLIPDDYNKIVVELIERREGKEIKDYKFLDMDESSIFFLDYKLLNKNSQNFLTGEEVAYLIRCYSKCKCIVGLNQFSDNEFDLTLGDHPESFCDINIGDKQLKNEGLWLNENWIFRPWYWPLLPDAVLKFDKKVKDVIDNFDSPVLEVLGFEKLVNNLPKQTLAYIGENPENNSFRDFVDKSTNGLRFNDKQNDIEYKARIAVARISKWIESYILRGQNILVDAPHLAYRFPSLLSGNIEDLENWNTACKIVDVGKLKLNTKIIEENLYKKNTWVSRNVWIWTELISNESILEVSEPFKRENIEYRFCEDSSQFFNSSNATEYKINLDSPYRTRYVKKPLHRGVDYKPKYLLF